MPVSQHGITADGGRPVVVAGNILRRQHGHDIGRGMHRCQIQPRDAPARHRAKPQRHVQRARRLGQVVDIGGRSGDMPVRTVMGDRFANGAIPAHA